MERVLVCMCGVGVERMARVEERGVRGGDGVGNSFRIYKKLIFMVFFATFGARGGAAIPSSSCARICPRRRTTGRGWGRRPPTEKAGRNWPRSPGRKAAARRRVW